MAAVYLGAGSSGKPSLSLSLVPGGPFLLARRLTRRPKAAPGTPSLKPTLSSTTSGGHALHGIPRPQQRHCLTQGSCCDEREVVAALVAGRHGYDATVMLPGEREAAGSVALQKEKRMWSSDHRCDHRGRPDASAISSLPSASASR